MKTRNLVPLLIALMLVLAACASTSDDTTTTTTTAAPSGGETTTTAAAAPETTTTSEDPTAAWPEKIVYGFIPSEQAETLGDTIQPYMDYLSAELGIEVEGVVTSDYNGLVVALGAGQADLGAFGPFGYVQADALYPDEMEVLIQSVRFGSGTYHGQWFTNDASICDEPPVPGAFENIDGVVTLVDPFDAVALQVGIGFADGGIKIPEVLDDGTPVDIGTVCTVSSLDVVKGKSVAFTSATSTSGGVFPQLQLINAGIDIEEDITYAYLVDHTSTVDAVYEGDFDIGLSFDDARRNVRKDADDNALKPDVGTKVIVFNITDEIPNDVVVARSELPADLQQAIYDATERFLETDDGILLFDEIYGWTGIRPAVDSDFDVVRLAALELGIEEN
jgi:phosphonate transport system substrate-binding protein